MFEYWMLSGVQWIAIEGIVSNDCLDIFIMKWMNEKKMDSVLCLPFNSIWNGYSSRLDRAMTKVVLRLGNSEILN
jgi:hypothetical protein